MTQRSPKTEQTLQEWVEKLSKENLPLFAHTARAIASLSTDCEATITQMSQSILSDSAMTARVLRMANSAHYNQSTIPISTVSRAIVVLGFNSVRNIALSVTLIDTVLSGIRHDRAIEEMIRGYHAAVQARSIAIEQGVKNEEEIFVITLLQRIGQLIFWCFPYGQAEILDFEYSMRQNTEEAERSILGFSLAELTDKLTEHWHLCDIMKSDLNQNPSQSGKKQQYIDIGLAIAKTSELGWASPEAQIAFKAASEKLNQPLSNIRELAYQNAQDTLESLLTLGIPNPGKIIPKVPYRKTETFMGETKPQPDNQFDLQLSILREISSMVFQGNDINYILNSVLEGIYRSLRMDRTVFAITSAETNSLQAKFVMGGHQEILMQRFNFSLKPREENIITYIFNTGTPTFLDRAFQVRHCELVTKETKSCIGENEAFLMPIFIGGKAKGLVYTDRCITKRTLERGEFQVFQHFCDHINIAFKMLSK